MGTLKIGWSEKSITPEKKASLAGQFAERISEYVEKPVTVTCMVIERDGEQMILCSEDLVAVGWNVVEEVRKRIAEAHKEIDPMKIILASIHTHTAPTVPRTSRLDSGKNASAKTYRQWLINELPAGRKYVEKVNISENPTTPAPSPSASQEPSASPSPSASPEPSPSSSASPEPSTPVENPMMLSKSEFTISEQWPQPVTLKVSNAVGDVVWSTSDATVAIVDSSGKVTGMGRGRCTITVTDAAGNKAECIVRCTIS